MTNDNFNDAARIIDEHRVISTAFGSTREGRSGRWATCLCGHESASYYDEQTAPIDSENNPERDVQRKHAVHIADVLARAALSAARAARRDGVTR